jgi:hypothetical protein
MHRLIFGDITSGVAIELYGRFGDNVIFINATELPDFTA